MTYELDGIGMNNVVKIADFDSAGRGNRFPVGRNRVPSSNFQKLGIFQRRNRFLYR